MDIKNVKKALYKERPIAHFVCDSKELGLQTENPISSYVTQCSLGEVSFDIPQSDMGNSLFPKSVEAQLLNRWIVSCGETKFV